MVLLLSCLKRRESWPEQFIEALEACEQMTLAAEIRAEYNALRGNSKSASQQLLQNNPSVRGYICAVDLTVQIIV